MKILSKIVLLVAIVSMLLLAVACSNNANSQADAEKQAMEQRKAADQGAIAQAEAQKAQLQAKYDSLQTSIDQQTEALKASLIKGDKVQISSNFERIAYGDMKAIVVGVRNDINYPSYFRVSVTFKQAYDTTRNPIDGIDDKSMALWIDSKSDLSAKLVEGGKNLFVPVYLNIKDIKAGTAPKKGTYVFTVTVKDGSADSQENTISKQDLSLLMQ